MFPNIQHLIEICCTIPTTSCECEHSGSALHRSNTYLRAGMGYNRHIFIVGIDSSTLWEESRFG